jgi:hypothetical protein
MTSPDGLADVRERVRARYAGAAATVLAGDIPTCGEPCSGEEATGTGAGQYSGTEQGEVPEQAVTASLGCGNKAAVLAESFRVLRPGGRLGVSDILAEDHLTPADRIDRGRQAGCIAGVLSFAEYRDGLARAGFTAIAITPTHQVADGLHSAIVRAARP